MEVNSSINNAVPLLEAKNLKKYFNTRKGALHAVDGINFKLYEGKTLGVVGASGCGKSTLGRVLIRLIEASEGQVLYKGQDIMTLGNNEICLLYTSY